MEYALIQPTEERLDDCHAIFVGSDIYGNYFAGTQMLQNTLQGGMRTGQLYAAQTPTGEIAGVMKVVPGGFCGLYPYLSLIGVSEKCQGGGVGKFLMGAFERMSRERGAKRTALMVSHLNSGALDFYRKLGYRELGLLENVVKEGLHERVMLKDL